MSSGTSAAAVAGSGGGAESGGGSGGGGDDDGGGDARDLLVMDGAEDATMQQREPVDLAAATAAAAAVAATAAAATVDSSADVAKLSVVHYENIEKRFGRSHVMFWVDVEARGGASSWTVKHRFSEFVELQKMLQKRFKECDFPSIRSSSQNPEHRLACVAAFLDYVSGFEEFLK